MYVAVGVERGDIGRQDIIQIAQPLQRNVQDGDAGTHSGGDLGGVDAHHPAADDGDFGRCDARNPAQQHATPTKDLLEVLGPLLHCHAPGNLGHRGE